MSLGFAIGFAIAEVKGIADRLWIMLAVLLFSFTLYVGMMSDCVSCFTTVHLFMQ